MLHKTKGIVLKTIKYSESSIITTVYTEKFGLQTYIVNGVRSAKAKGKAALYQHGNILDLVVYHKENANVLRISEVKMENVYKEIPYAIEKSSLLLFSIEVLNKTIKEEESNALLYTFIEHAFLFLDETHDAIAHFPIVFLLELSKLLGFSPAQGKGKYFNLQEGNFENTIPQNNYYMNEVASAHLHKFLQVGFENKDYIHIDAQERSFLLKQLLLYYKLHIAGFGELHSPEILHTVLH